MARAPKFANVTVNAEADAISDLLDAGKLRIYDGAKPATADTAITTQNLLAELTLNATAAPAAVDGVLTFNSITSDPSANMTGTATWCRFLKSDGTTVIMDGTVGEGGNYDVTLTTVDIIAAAVVPLASLSLRVSKG